jgi:hypothetical protein
VHVEAGFQHAALVFGQAVAGQGDQADVALVADPRRRRATS